MKYFQRVFFRALIVLLALAMSGCGARTENASASHSADVINFALPPNATPNWILPIGVPGKMATQNSSISQSLFSPLLDFDGSRGKMALDLNSGLAKSLDFSPDGKTVTIHLRTMHWSDGAPITSRDVEFWFNLITANKDQYGGYKAGRLPDNITHISYADPHTLSLTFDKAYNRDWLISSQLILIRPLPFHAWGNLSLPAGTTDGDRTSAGAKKIFAALIAASQDLSSYATNPLWKTVSGPMTLSAFDTSGKVTLTKNTHYDGPDPAHATTVNLLPFTSTDAEVNVLRAQGIDYGYIPSTLIGQAPQFESKGFTMKPWTGWSITYLPYNFNNPQMGPVFKQLYVRQALQSAVDQPNISRVIFQNSAKPVYGPVPQDLPSPYLSPIQSANPYPYDEQHAKDLLAAHGWSPGSDGILQCDRPGTAADQCGQDIAQGTSLDLRMLVQSGSSEVDKQFAVIQSSFRKIGVRVDFDKAPLNSVLDRTVPCKPTQSECSWQFSYFGAAGSWYFEAYPTGERLFSTGASANFGSFSDPKVDSLMAQAIEGNSPKTMQEYSAYLAQVLPVLWVPNPVYQVSMIRQGLTGTTQDPTANFYPQRWGWNK